MTRHLNPATRAVDPNGDGQFLSDPRAACAGQDPELFFSDAGGYAHNARDICARCPLIDPCRAYAVARPWLSGTWGGTTGNDRDRIRRQQREATS